MVSQEVSTLASDSEAQQPQTLYVAIQPGAESGQGEQPAVYLEVVEAGSGTEVTSSDGQVNLVQEEMIIDNGMHLENRLLYGTNFSTYEISILSSMRRVYEDINHDHVGRPCLPALNVKRATHKRLLVSIETYSEIFLGNLLTSLTISGKFFLKMIENIPTTFRQYSEKLQKSSEN